MGHLKCNKIKPEVFQSVCKEQIIKGETWIENFPVKKKYVIGTQIVLLNRLMLLLVCLLQLVLITLSFLYCEQSVCITFSMLVYTLIQIKKCCSLLKLSRVHYPINKVSTYFRYALKVLILFHTNFLSKWKVNYKFNFR